MADVDPLGTLVRKVEDVTREWLAEVLSCAVDEDVITDAQARRIIEGSHARGRHHQTSAKTLWPDLFPD